VAFWACILLLNLAVKGVSKKQLRNKLAGKLVEENALLRERIVLLEKRGELLSQENAFLRQKVDLLVRRVFGVSSEKLDPSQLDLFLLQGENTPGKSPASSPLEEAEPQPPTRAKAKRGRERWPQDLPVVEQVIEPEEVKTQPQAWRCIGEEISEQLDYEPARFLRRRLIRRKYVSRQNPEVAPILAPLPSVLQERGGAAPGLLAQIIVSKYCDHLPLYRQEQIYRTRHGVSLSRPTMVRWVEMIADWLKPIYQCIRTGVMAGGYVQVDETPVRYLSPGNGKTKTGYFWATSRPGGDAVYQWETSRAATCLDNVLPVDFKGTVQCDGYAAYASYARRREHLQLAACWAHARRKFYEAREQDPLIAGWLLRQIGHLYRIEGRLRRAKSGPQLRAAVRAHQARFIYQRLHRVLTHLKTKRRYLPRSRVGVAIDYTLNLWPLLGVYLNDGRIEIDQNLVENAIRPTALGKKNWLFIGEAEAGERSAILYTIVECCRRRGLDPYAYLRDILTRLPHATNWQIKTLTPEAWAQEHRLASIPQAA
jgi:transposase